MKSIKTPNIYIKKIQKKIDNSSPSENESKFKTKIFVFHQIP
jgi:hypothetical protein